MDAVYLRLGFAEGDLHDAADRPTDGSDSNWVEKGDWLALAKKVGAEKVFFVNNYPVIVFAEQPPGDAAGWMRYFNSIWCMARPQMLFLAREGELSVYNLTMSPARKSEDRYRSERLLAAVRATADVQDKLSNYRRDQVESGRLFEDRRFGSGDRADRALIRDLGKVRKELIDAGLSATYAHALIGRSIFIRYLEDRRVLTEEYFRKVAKGDKTKWPKLLDEEFEAVTAGTGRRVFYPAVLGNKAFAYALFTKLSEDFNGDMFPVDAEEYKAVNDKHLKLLRKLLLADVDDKLFFFAYQFDIIPIELISSIYEKFYSTKPGQKRDDGSYYTPAALVDFVLSQTLDAEELQKRPRVMDPACGSGIFLVEAFRRIVRHRFGEAKRRLRPDELRTILRDQIAGIDINPEAVRVTAFSLYLAMLHYLDPPDILQHKLPCLTYTVRPKTDVKKHFDILVAEDAFQIEDTITSEAVRQRFTSGCADIVVGNPPWGSPRSDVPEELRSDGGVAWCAARNRSLGDKERSQSFIHRSIDLLREGGRAGLLVSTGVFFKRGDTTRKFREQWLSETTLRKVINFAAVREAYFQPDGKDEEDGKGSIAPFAAAIFDKGKPEPGSAFSYWSAKETAFVRHVKAVVLNRADFCYGIQDEFLSDDTLWKIHWWGTHRDRALIQRLRLEKSFQEVLDPDGTRMRVGFQEASRKDESDWLLEFKEFPTDHFERYGPLPTDKFLDPPDRVHRRRERFIYEGARLLIKRGIDQSAGLDGQIAARFETEPFCFRDSIHCVSVEELGEEKAKVLLAILWSSLTRYYLFLTSGTWGLWHDEVKKDVLYSIPVRFPKKAPLLKKILKAVDALREIEPAAMKEGLFQEEGLSPKERAETIRRLEAQLDRAVFDLFELTDEERERITELCGLGLDLYYKGMESEAVQPLDWPDKIARQGYLADLEHANGNELAHYLATYVKLWEPHLEDQGGCLRWRIVRPPGASSMLATVFHTQDKGERNLPTTSDEQEWIGILGRLSESSLQHARANRVYIDGLIRLVTDADMVIIKRNERRLWTPSVARDDAEATMLMVMQMTSRNGK